MFLVSLLNADQALNGIIPSNDVKQQLKLVFFENTSDAANESCNTRFARRLVRLDRENVFWGKFGN
jgi:hypothetical protein